VEGHGRDHEPLGRARHGLVAGNLPLHDGGEWRKLDRLDETKQLLAGHIGPRPVRHRSGKVSGVLVAQEVAALWMRKSTRGGGGEEASAEKEDNRKQSPEPVLDARLKRDECDRSP
jgi:hypothetical protein